MVTGMVKTKSIMDINSTYLISNLILNMLSTCIILYNDIEIGYVSIWKISRTEDNPPKWIGYLLDYIIKYLMG